MLRMMANANNPPSTQIKGSGIIKVKRKSQNTTAINVEDQSKNPYVETPYQGRASHPAKLLIKQLTNKNNAP